MGILDVLNPINTVVSAVGGILDKFITSPEDKLAAQKMLADAQAKAQEMAAQTEAQRAETVRAEITGHSLLQRNWRPITALIFVFIIFNNFVLAPYVHAFGGSLPILDLPPMLWATLSSMLAGYTGLRTYEKRMSAKVDTDAVVSKVLNAIGDARK